MGIIDLIMGWGVISEETPINEVEFESLDISLLRHFPKASLELVDYSVTGVGEFEGQTLVAGERIEVAVDVMSIFGESFEISKVWLLSPKINGVVTKGGAVNWDIMKPTDAEADVEVESVEEESDSVFKLSLKSLSIEKGEVAYTDSQSNMTFRTAPVNLFVSGDLSAATTTLNVDASAGNITFISGAEMKAGIKQFYQVLFDANPKAVGGSLPGEEFYYQG